MISSDSVPIPFAYVTIDGGSGRITDERGEVSIGAGKGRGLNASVRRIGYQAWLGKVEFADTATVFTVVLVRVAQGLSEVRVTAQSAAPSAALKGFYDRWMERQRGALSAVFIGPEELEFRHPDKVTNMLAGLNGVMLKRGSRGWLEAWSSTGSCRMAVLVDGIRQCPPLGCNVTPDHPCPPPGTRFAPPGCDPDQQSVFIDQIVEANTVTAIEVYARGGNVPVSLSSSDQACGIVAVWTGARKP
ncbi:MAG TPA: hypothetical protein VN613_03665 [Gemmatimonadaceae bacterium]|nr:hypothetical protein [Gemmatimonadaceae bacterium]